MTAGHCVDNEADLRDKLSVRCGEWDTQSEDEIFPYQERRVNRIMVRLGYLNNISDFVLTRNTRTWTPVTTTTTSPYCS